MIIILDIKRIEYTMSMPYANVSAVIEVRRGEEAYTLVHGGIPTDLDDAAIQAWLDERELQLWSVAQKIGTPVTPEERVERSARQLLSAIPEWATWSTQQFTDWFAEHVQDVLGQAPPSVTQGNILAVVNLLVPVVQAMANTIERQGQVIVALRDSVHPDLRAEVLEGEQ